MHISPTHNENRLVMAVIVTMLKKKVITFFRIVKFLNKYLCSFLHHFKHSPITTLLTQNTWINYIITRFFQKLFFHHHGPSLLIWSASEPVKIGAGGESRGIKHGPVTPGTLFPVNQCCHPLTQAIVHFQVDMARFGQFVYYARRRVERIRIVRMQNNAFGELTLHRRCDSDPVGIDTWSKVSMVWE